MTECVGYSSTRRKHVGQVRCERDRFVASRPSLLDPLLVPARVPLVIEAEHVGQTGISGSEIGVYLSGTLIHLDGKLQVLARHPAGVAAATQIEIVGLRIGRRLGLNRLLFL